MIRPVDTLDAHRQDPSRKTGWDKLCIVETSGDTVTMAVPP
jgi:hypothetical protein